MKRVWVLIATAALAVAIVYELFPRLDITVSAPFYRPPPELPAATKAAAAAYLRAYPDVAEQGQRPDWTPEHAALYHYQRYGRDEGREHFGLAAHPQQDWANVGFVLQDSAFGDAVYEGFLWGPRVLLLALAAMLAASWVVRTPATREWRRQAGFVLLVAGLGQGLLVNGLLKEHWGRARPIMVQEFGGTQRFTPPLRVSDQCESNCSFPSGHAAGAFALMAFGMVTAGAWRRRWFVIGLTAGAAVGLVRMLQGAHFLSDVVFSLFCTLLGIALATWVFRMLGQPVAPSSSAASDRLGLAARGGAN